MFTVYKCKSKSDKGDNQLNCIWMRQREYFLNISKHLAKPAIKTRSSILQLVHIFKLSLS